MYVLYIYYIYNYLLFDNIIINIPAVRRLLKLVKSLDRIFQRISKHGRFKVIEIRGGGGGWTQMTEELQNSKG